MEIYEGCRRLMLNRVDCLKFVNIFKRNCAANVIVAALAKWVIVRLFERSHCRFSDGTILSMGLFYK